MEPNQTNEQWKKSSYSAQGNCVEVSVGSTVKVRHTKRPDDATIEYSHDEWLAFTRGVKAGEFDL
jgi:putative sterol carrier protein